MILTSCIWRGHSGLWRGISAGVAASFLSVAALAGDVGTGSKPASGPSQQNAPLVVPARATSTERMRLLSQEQYLNTVKYIFGSGIAVSPNFAPLARTDGLLEVGASTAGVTFGQLGEYQRTASDLAKQVVSPQNRGFLIQCKPRNATRADPRCAKRFLSRVGELLYRRPLTRAQLNQSVDEASMAAGRLKDFYQGLSYALSDMLISPDVLFVVDHTQPDPQNPGQSRLDGYSIASRLSLFLWDSAPDHALLQAAARGQLYTPEGRARAVDRMLASPRLVTGVRAFFYDMLDFDNTTNLAKDPEIYPAFTGSTAQAAREQVLRTIVNQLVTKNGDYRDLFTMHATFMSPQLSPIYDVPAAMGWTPYQFPAGGPRAGLLTMVGFLAAHSHAGQSSPTLRGRAVRQLLLCENIPNPPANVDFSAITNPNPALKTMRQRLELHRRNPVCAGCHRLMDPIGLGLEDFDGAGKFRTTQNGVTIDASGTLDGMKFANATDLGKDVHDDPALAPCLTQRLYAYAVGGLSKSDGKAMLPYLDKSFAQEGYRVPSLMRTIALSPAFIDVRTPLVSKPTPVVAMEHSPASAGE